MTWKFENLRFKKKACGRCAKRFTPRSGVAKYCDACKPIVVARQKYDWVVRKGLIKRPGIGLGHNYDPDGPLRYRDFKKSACERCGSKRFLVGHHKDGRGLQSRRPNNARSNIETLCKSCHQKEHGAGRHLTEAGRRALSIAAKKRMARKAA